jgi:hypothetical protein
VWEKVHDPEDTEIPTAWFQIHFLDALDTLERGKVIMNAGRLYIAYDNLRQTTIPEIARNSYQKMTEKVVYNLAPSEVVSYIEQEMENTRSILSAKPVTNQMFLLDIKDMPPIEEAHRHFPLCQYISHSNLTRGEIHHSQRRGMVSFLKYCGFPTKAIDNYCTKILDEKDKSKKKAIRKIEIRALSKKVIDPKKPPYTRGCERLISEAVGSIGDPKTHLLGCPFQHFDKPLLARSLESMGVKDKDRIESIIHTAQTNPDDACCRTLDYFVPSDTNTRQHWFPHNYFADSVKRHIEMEFEK